MSTPEQAAKPGDQARASVFVRVDVPTAFEIFTAEIDRWWRRGFRFRSSGRDPGTMVLERGVGGRVYERIERSGATEDVEIGRVLLWEPPSRFVLEWRAQNFAPDERTEVEVSFEPRREGAWVTITHRGWAAIRPDHPARHGEAVDAFLRTMGLWWGDLLSSLRAHAARAAESATRSSRD